ncbi:MAG TPA: hypothetical protein VN663_23260 [Ramlibacter sp.]|nr:hypothetical protein [Ramlibacter sp.]
MIAFVIVTGLIRGVIYMPLAIVFMRNGNGLVAQSRMQNARVDDAAGQPEQPDQQYIDCESAKTLGLGEHGRLSLGGA